MCQEEPPTTHHALMTTGSFRRDPCQTLMLLRGGVLLLMFFAPAHRWGSLYFIHSGARVLGSETFRIAVGVAKDYRSWRRYESKLDNLGFCAT